MAGGDGSAAGPGGLRRGARVALLAVAAVVAVMAMAIAAVGVVAWRRPADHRPTMAIVGDSITEQARSVLRRELGHDWRLRVDGRPGATVAEQLAAARTLAEGDPAQVIVDLGTNDVLQGRSPDASADDLRQLVASFPDAACIHLVTVNEEMVLGEARLQRPAAELNTAIASMAADDPRLDVVDWAEAVRTYQAGPQPDGPITSDSVHPTGYGKQVLAGLYADALAGCRAGAPSATGVPG